MYLYVFEGFTGGTDRQKRTEELVIRAVKDFAAEKKIILTDTSCEICRTDKGKPYFKNLPIEFSVSHTEDLWVCLLSDAGIPVGVDIQKVKETYQERIAEKYFTDKEKSFLAEGGTDAFFAVWTRKEAYAKYTGEGITKKLSEICTLNNKELIFTEFDTRAGIKGACCMKEEGDLCIRMM